MMTTMNDSMIISTPYRARRSSWGGQNPTQARKPGAQGEYAGEYPVHVDPRASSISLSVAAARMSFQNSFGEG